MLEKYYSEACLKFQNKCVFIQGHKLDLYTYSSKRKNQGKKTSNINCFKDNIKSWQVQAIFFKSQLYLSGSASYVCQLPPLFVNYQLYFFMCHLYLSGSASYISQEVQSICVSVSSGQELALSYDIIFKSLNNCCDQTRRDNLVFFNCL